MAITHATEQRASTAATVAIISAIGGIILIFSGHPFWGMVVELAAICIGVVGLVMAASPRVSGGILSVVAIVIGLLGLGMSLFGIVGAMLT
ncbi:MAG: hypothetical protein L0Y44_15965 [Phycisphaerales bacterium]|nr:hypothetical protein [Phycisphaerales bacterium]MCI0676057.1 hypothetical protein [Phycisphaerales bacterium]